MPQDTEHQVAKQTMGGFYNMLDSIAETKNPIEQNKRIKEAQIAEDSREPTAEEVAAIHQEDVAALITSRSISSTPRPPPPMALSPSNPIIFDADSASRPLSELSGLDSVLFGDLDVEDFDTSSSAGTQSPEPASKRRKLRALSTWSYARAPCDDKDLKNKQGRRYFYCGQCPYWRDVSTTNIRAAPDKKTRHIRQGARIGD